MFQSCSLKRKRHCKVHFIDETTEPIREVCRQYTKRKSLEFVTPRSMKVEGYPATRHKKPNQQK